MRIPVHHCYKRFCYFESEEIFFFFFEAAASNSVHSVIFEDWILCAFGLGACCEMPSLPL